MIPSLPGSTSPAETGTFADGDPDASLGDQAACLFTIACWCITSARAELSGNGWDAGQEAALTHSFENLTDTWTTYKGVLAFLPGADGQAGRPAGRHGSRSWPTSKNRAARSPAPSSRTTRGR